MVKKKKNYKYIYGVPIYIRFSLLIFRKIKAGDAEGTFLYFRTIIRHGRRSASYDHAPFMTEAINECTVQRLSYKYFKIEIVYLREISDAPPRRNCHCATNPLTLRFCRYR